MFASIIDDNVALLIDCVVDVAFLHSVVVVVVVVVVDVVAFIFFSMKVNIIIHSSNE